MKYFLPLILISLMLFSIGCVDSGCSPMDSESCQKTCENNGDCKSSCCGCISSEETCGSQNLACQAPRPCYDSCVCVNGKCTPEKDVIREALEKEDPSICKKSSDAECREYCQQKVEEKINESLPVEEVELATDKSTYAMNEEITLTVMNKGKEPIYFYKGFVRFAPADDPSWEQILLSHYEDFVAGCESNPSKDCEKILLKPSDSINVSVSEEKDEGTYSLAIVFTDSSLEYSNPFMIGGSPEMFVTTDKEVYELGETIKANFHNNIPVYILFDERGDWQISRFEDGDWEVLRPGGILEYASCDSNETRCGIKSKVFSIQPILFPEWIKINTNTSNPRHSWTWNQKTGGFKEITCNNKSGFEIQWNCTEYVLTEPGKHKISFRYWMENYSQDPDFNDYVIHVEKEFEIVSQEDEKPEDYCEQDSDCLHQDACCHPCGTECVNKDNFVPANCEQGDYACTTVVVSGTDCVCVNNTCTGIPGNETC